MSNRHLARTIAMQSLFMWDFNEKREVDFPAVLKALFENFAPEFDDSGFAGGIVEGVQKNIKKIDRHITKYATEWPLDQITIVDRNILRIGVFELVFNEEIPAKVAINEAIEIGKAFGGESSGKFINGVLGAIYRDIQTPEQKEADEKTPAAKRDVVKEGEVKEEKEEEKKEE